MPSTPPSIPLWDSAPPGEKADGFVPTLDLYPLGGPAERGAVLVCPGGGYAVRAPHEAEPVARALNAGGFHAFVVQYRVSPHRHPSPLMDASRAIRVIRARAAEWKVRPDRVAILGFSAGGHLAASLGTLHPQYPFAGEDPLHSVSNRPDALVLCYAVLSSGLLGHARSVANLLGEKAEDPPLRRQLSPELNVGPHTPPSFLWHTVTDQGVPVDNSLLFTDALRRHGVPVELHLYPKGRHGLGLGDAEPCVRSWMRLCCEWLAALGW